MLQSFFGAAETNQKKVSTIPTTLVEVRLIQTPMQYLKLDGSLMEKLATDSAVQEKVRVYVGAASKRGIPTIAERVENANTMAVLFQLGVAYVQGHYVHEPEVVLGDVATTRR